MDLLLHELAGRVSKQQMDIVHLKQGGYGIREIARTQKVPMRRIKELLAEVHDVLLDICYGCQSDNKTDKCYYSDILTASLFNERKIIC